MDRDKILISREKSQLEPQTPDESSPDGLIDEKKFAQILRWNQCILPGHVCQDLTLDGNKPGGLERHNTPRFDAGMDASVWAKRTDAEPPGGPPWRTCLTGWKHRVGTGDMCLAPLPRPRCCSPQGRSRDCGCDRARCWAARGTLTEALQAHGGSFGPERDLRNTSAKFLLLILHDQTDEKHIC